MMNSKMRVLRTIFINGQNSFIIRNINKVHELNPLTKRCASNVLFPDESFELGDFESDVNKYLKRKKKDKGKVYQSIMNQEKYEKETPIIICKNSKLNHYRNQTYDKFKAIPLASENWRSHKSVGDYFKIKIHADDYSPSTRMKKISCDESGLNPCITEILKSREICELSEIQQLALPHILDGKNTLLGAETGSGKTLAYLVPIVEQVLNWKKGVSKPAFNSPLVLILSPSRELTDQIAEVCKWFAPLGIKSNKIKGGRVNQRISNPYFEEIDILVSTPGVIGKLTDADIYNLHNVRHVVMDEADCLLDDSFNQLLIDFLGRIKFRSLPSEDLSQGVQLTMVSATLPTSLADILDNIIDVECLEHVTTNKMNFIMPNVTHKFLRTGRASRPTFMLDIAKKDFRRKSPSMIFCNRAETCIWLNTFLNDNDIPNVIIYGDMSLKERRIRFENFQKGKIDTLVCTTIASRGLDTYRVENVVNYEFPFHIADYIHRAGRTGRLSSKKPGIVTNLIAGRNEVQLVQKIETAVRNMLPFENVNPNIARILKYRNASNFDRELGLMD